ncbi:Nif11-like leader peptide family natural product precursor [Altericista sp. CCNU0014]|uniref:Nif11-like leader peptide family natural product precursor n=1 Tax=Altericista sp. CCNU0014 TaxID=3082949 RepID=UPI00384E9BFA
MNIVHLFFQQLFKDVNLRSQLQNATCRATGWAIAKAAGYEFTMDELETYASHVLDGTLPPVDEAELSAVVGGFMTLMRPISGAVQEYGSVPPLLD